MIIEQLHDYIAAKDTGYSRHVPQSAFDYYAATLAYARILKINKRNGRMMTHDEVHFMDSIYEKGFAPPVMLANYPASFGNTTLDKIQLEARFRQRDYAAGDDESIGWFGHFDAQTHLNYLHYPCLAVYIARIVHDLTDDPDADPWDFPANIHPVPILDDDDAIAVHPNRNILGYGVATRLSSYQTSWLTRAGFAPDGTFETSNQTIPLCHRKEFKTSINN